VAERKIYTAQLKHVAELSGQTLKTANRFSPIQPLSNHCLDTEVKPGREYRLFPAQFCSTWVFEAGASYQP